MYSFLLRRLENWAPLSDEDHDALNLMSIGKPRRVEARQKIYNEGEKRKNAIYLISGWLCRYKQLEDGRYQIMSFVLPGDICCSYDPFDSGVAHSVSTVGEAITLDLDHARLEAALLGNTSLAKALRTHNSVEAGMLRERVLSLGQRTAIERCAHLLCELFWRLRAVGLTSDSSFQFPITQEDVANAIGTSTVHANRVLQSLRSSGLIQWTGKKQLKILNLRKLESLALFSPRFLCLTESAPARVETPLYVVGAFSRAKMLKARPVARGPIEQAS